jgi:hypothetical protein
MDMDTLACHATTMRLLGPVHEACVTKDVSPRMEEFYGRWVERSFRFHRSAMGEWIQSYEFSAFGSERIDSRKDAKVAKDEQDGIPQDSH